jgi:glucokinase
MSAITLLVGDIGGTNARFALVTAGDNGLRVSGVWKQKGADFPAFGDALDAYLQRTQAKPDGAAFGVAGAVSHGRVDLLHRSWTMDRREISDRLGGVRVVLVNDFFAMARAAPELPPTDLADIAPGEADDEAAIAVGGPGTGFGIAILRRIPGGWVVVAGEGGHQTYIPVTDLEWRVAENLRAQGLYVSAEVVCSGSGFEQTRAALAEAMKLPELKLDQAGIIAAAGQGDLFALEFCRLRARTVMTSMGNMALAAKATGGVCLAGGVSQHLIPWLREKAALDRFRQRGPRTELVSRIPITLIMSETAPLLGAARLWLDEETRGWL